MKIYRCTRCTCTNPNARAYSDLSARQGYYVRAENESEALKQMARDFPKETNFTCHEWSDSKDRSSITREDFTRDSQG
jgi:hypothetical protein